MSAVPSPALVDRYRTRAPRYTSYPTAPQFRAITEAELREPLSRGEGPVSLYVHVPFCQRLCHYCGCHVEIRKNRDLGLDYVDSVLREAALWHACQRPGRALGQLALGGGTPTFLRSEELSRLVDGLAAIWPRADGAELSIEVDPRTVSPEELEALPRIGFTRVNLGVQDVDEQVLAAVNRPQPFPLVEQAFSVLRGAGLSQVGVDLVYGLPSQTEASFEATLDAVAGLRPTRIALFQYAHVPWLKPQQKLIERFARPDSDGRTRMWALAREKLGAEGYVEVGMDHFALPGDELVSALENGSLQRNFEGYTTHAGLDLLGLGVSAIGGFDGAYAQNTKDRERYAQLLAEGKLAVERGVLLSADDVERRRVIMSLFCNFTVDLGNGDYGEERVRLGRFVDDGLVTVDGTRVSVTPAGRFFIRNVCAVFDRYLEADVASRRYSETA
ncbi:MAG: oxygen-independent coproporphyrinogen III oxidase [Deltaproteobacteria bacterium]|nr:oxygen-independent coproporphyrinogen III oxidase [Deltaproteobacteria bacterium]